MGQSMAFTAPLCPPPPCPKQGICLLHCSGSSPLENYHLAQAFPRPHPPAVLYRICILKLWQTHSGQSYSALFCDHPPAFALLPWATKAKQSLPHTYQPFTYTPLIHCLAGAPAVLSVLQALQARHVCGQE